MYKRHPGQRGQQARGQRGRASATLRRGPLSIRGTHLLSSRPRDPAIRAAIHAAVAAIVQASRGGGVWVQGGNPTGYNQRVCCGPVVHQQLRRLWQGSVGWAQSNALASKEACATASEDMCRAWLLSGRCLREAGRSTHRSEILEWSVPQEVGHAAGEDVCAMERARSTAWR